MICLWLRLLGAAVQCSLLFDHNQLKLPQMSLQVNITGADILKAYQDVLNQNGIDWALFSYDKGTNDLKLQSSGDGGLEELEDEFSDGRCVCFK